MVQRGIFWENSLYIEFLNSINYEKKNHANITNIIITITVWIFNQKIWPIDGYVSYVSSSRRSEYNMIYVSSSK